ncbi:VOC family protein [Bordetella petrii]|uniref:VOC family protein n=1 Tax=Bordetella petrii TaxID=94624 RepID=UPI003731E8D8
MYTHIQIGARDWPRLVAFYDTVLAPLGLLRVNSIDSAGPAGVIWRPPTLRWPSFVVAPPFNGLPATWGNGAQVSFRALSCDIVDRCWTLAIEAGGRNEGLPGLRTWYAPDFYAAYCRDPEGNKIAFVCAGEQEPDAPPR